MFGQYGINQTRSYDSVIQEYRDLSKKYTQCDLIEFGKSDHGKPIYLFVVNNSRTFFKESFRYKSVVLVQNGIHAGEPCGVDASLEWITNMLEADSVPPKVVIGIIPAYNIGGMHNRSCCSRANQNGPEVYGFRGNGRNLDLNRDYIKADSRNTKAFRSIFNWLQPDYFVDTHTSNGADYQYDMTLLFSRPERYSTGVREIFEGEFMPYLFEKIQAPPYVNTLKQAPNSGLVGFNDIPRFSSGYTSLYDCMSLVTEAHMWKPYQNRVKKTIEVLEAVAYFANQKDTELRELKNTQKGMKSNDVYGLNFKLDTTKSVDLEFLGFEYYF